MKGYFVTITKDNLMVFVYEFEYSVENEESECNGTWEPSQLIKRNDNYTLLRRTPGYSLLIKNLPNVYFEKFCQTTDIQCNGWTQHNVFPYKVTRYKNDRMFFLMAQNLSTYPVDVNQNMLITTLKKRFIHDNYKIFYCK